MSYDNDLSKITQIVPNLYLSGVFPIDNENDLINKLNIKYILCCFDRNYIAEVHDKILINNPSITILYLPYNDDIYQNLWTTNKNHIRLIRFTNTQEDYNKLIKQTMIYNNKP